MKLLEILLGEYSKLINYDIIADTLKLLQKEYNTKNILPLKSNVFKAFTECPYKDLRVVFIGQDPYPQKGYATGLAFANPVNTSIVSPGLQVIKDRIEKDFPDYSTCDLPLGEPYDFFDVTLESWAHQGVLLLNSALTVVENNIGSHSNIWYPFIKDLLINLSEINCGIIYVLFGNEAKTLKPFINKRANYVLEYHHPAYYVRTNQEFDCDCFIKINQILQQNNNIKINWK